ncbi:MAG: hypothetical protein ACREOE_09300, partial [Gemmatimonadales bacterium]
MIVSAMQPAVETVTAGARLPVAANHSLKLTSGARGQQRFPHRARLPRCQQDPLGADPPGPRCPRIAQQRRQRPHVRRPRPRRQAELLQQMPGQRHSLRLRSTRPACHRMVRAASWPGQRAPAAGQQNCRCH